MNMSRELPHVREQVSAEKVLASHFTLVAQPDAIEPLLVDGAEGWTSPNPHPVLSLMRWTTQDPDKAAAALDHVLERFRDAGRGFDWMTGPGCADAGLLPLLESRGCIQPSLQVAAMVKHIDQSQPLLQPAGVQIYKVDDFADGRIWGVMADGFDIPDDVAATFHHAYVTPSHLQKSDVYAATVDGNDAPLGVGYLSYIGDGPAVLLRVSCTLENSRGRGIYSALVARRLYDAAHQGRTQAFVHAYSQESVRCLERQGFVNAGPLLLHRWRP